MTSNQLEKDYDNFAQKMTNYESLYDWSHNNDSDSLTILANDAWDKLQKVGSCCGLIRREDWNKWRPLWVPYDEYPSSCCLTFRESNPAMSPKCHEGQLIWRDGCLEVVHKFLENNLLSYTIFLLSDFSLSIIGFIVGQGYSVSNSLKEF